MLKIEGLFFYNVEDSHHLDADPDPVFNFDVDSDPVFNFGADPDQTFHFDAVQYPTFCFDADPALMKVLHICNHWPKDLPMLQCEPPRFHCEPPQLQDGAPWLYCELHISQRVEALLDPTFHFGADPDPHPAPNNHADPCGSGFTSLLVYSHIFEVSNRFRI